MYDIKQLFNVQKPIIGMSHFGALPGDPKFDPDKGLDQVADDMLKDICALQRGGVDGIMFSNEHSQPWMLNNYSVTLNSMAYVIGSVRKQIKLPFGVHVIWDARLTMDLAVATRADFAWEVFAGAYASDYGVWNNVPGEYMRHNREIYGKKTRIFCEIIPEAAKNMGKRTLQSTLKTALLNVPADAICIAGLQPGVPPSTDLLSEIKSIAGSMSVIVSTGVKLNNVKEYLNIVDGAIVGSCLKKDGYLFNQVDEDRVKEFMACARNV